MCDLNSHIQQDTQIVTLDWQLSCPSLCVFIDTQELGIKTQQCPKLTSHVVTAHLEDT